MILPLGASYNLLVFWTGGDVGIAYQYFDPKSSPPRPSLLWFPPPFADQPTRSGYELVMDISHQEHFVAPIVAIVSPIVIFSLGCLLTKSRTKPVSKPEPAHA
jgi:hypothetical protein